MGDTLERRSGRPLRGAECLGKDVPGEGNSEHEDLKVRMCRAHSRNDLEAAEAA